MGRVLVTDGFWHKTLAVVRALGQEGIGVAVAAETRFAASFHSRYCERRLLCPTARENPQGFLDCLLSEVSRAEYEIIIPMEDDTIALLGEHRSLFAAHTHIPIPPQDSVVTALDKWKTLEVGRQLSIPVPITYAVSDLCELNEISQVVPYPAVIKPRRSWGARGIGVARTPEELREKFGAIHQHYPFPLIQEQLPLEGSPLAVSLLFAQNHEPIAGFVQKSLREYPLTGGSSTLRESIADHVLLHQAIALLKALKWYGVAMVEFRLDPRDGRAKLMEINPRFWNSIQLAIDAGVNFPVLLYRMATREPFKPAFEYPLGIRSRWLLPGDILHFVSNPDRWSMVPSFFAFLNGRTRCEDFSLADPGGMLGVWLSILYSVFKKDMWRFVLKREVGGASGRTREKHSHS